MAKKKKKPVAKKKRRYGVTVRKNGRLTITKVYQRNAVLTLTSEIASRSHPIPRLRGRKIRGGVGRILIDKQWWNIVVTYVPLRGIWGYYDEALELIVLDGTASDQNFLDTLIHEASHALDSKRPEPVILKQGNSLSNLLTAFGYKN